MSIADELAAAEIHLCRAVAQLGKIAGSAKQMPSGRVWVGSLTEYKRAVRLLLATRELERRTRRYEQSKREESAVAEGMTYDQMIDESVSCGDNHG